jgi:hypothetical protein
VSFEGVTIKASPWKVLALAQLMKEGRLHLPDLQRGFVWSPERVRALLDSLYRRYPVGALLLWKPSWTGQELPFVTRPWDLSPSRPETSVPTGAYFVLDGQQRLTSLFRVIFTSRHCERPTPDPDLLVSLASESAWTESPFHLRTRQLEAERGRGLLIPAEVLFEGVRSGSGDGASLAIQRVLSEWIAADSPLFFQALDRANAIRNAILGAEIVAYEIDADVEDDNVIEIFARLNQQGVRLRPGDLAAARLTGTMKGFRDRARRVLALPELRGFTALEGGEDSPRSGAFVDTDLLVRTALFLATGHVRYRDVEDRRQGVRETYAQIEVHWDAAVEGLSKAVALLRKGGVPDGTWLPYRYLLLPLAVAEARHREITATQWLGWVIAASLWGHYESGAETRAQADAKLAAEGKLLELYQSLQSHARRVQTLIPDAEELTHHVPLESGVALAMRVYLTKTRARSFPSGQPLAGQAQPLELHSLFPRFALDKLAYRDSTTAPDRIGNLTLLCRADSEALREKLPADFLTSCEAQDLEQHGIPAQQRLWDTHQYDAFCLFREKAIAGQISDLLRTFGVP